MSEQNEIRHSDPDSGMLADPEAVKKVALAAELEELNAQNQGRLRALTQGGVQIEPLSMLSLRIDTLAQMVFGEDSPLLLEYKLRVQKQLAGALRELSGEIRKAQFGLGAQATPQQLEQLARATGLLGPDGRPLG